MAWSALSVSLPATVLVGGLDVKVRPHGLTAVHNFFDVVHVLATDRRSPDCVRHDPTGFVSIRALFDMNRGVVETMVHGLDLLGGSV